MTEQRPILRRLPVAAGATAALLALAGCSGTNVGSDWQCPLAQGTACTSIAEADLAVVRTDAADNVATRGPLHKGDAAEAPEKAGTGDGMSACGENCNPLSWLAELFGTNESKTADVAPAKLAEEVARHAEAVPGADARDKPQATNRTPSPVAPTPEDDLRTGEAIGRIWIAPFVDGAGVYREAGWVRVVIEPAGWRLP